MMGGGGTRVINVLSQWKSLACMITSSETKTSPSSINAPRSRREITTEDKCRNQVNKSARKMLHVSYDVKDDNEMKSR